MEPYDSLRRRGIFEHRRERRDDDHGERADVEGHAAVLPEPRFEFCRPDLAEQRAPNVLDADGTRIDIVRDDDEIVPGDGPPVPVREPVAVADDWDPVIAADAVPARRVVAVDVAADEAVAWRTRSGPPCVMARRCPHLDCDLTDAIVMGDELLCAGHGWSLRADGIAFKRNEHGREDAKGAIRTWPARERDGWIEVERPGA